MPDPLDDIVRRRMVRQRRRDTGPEKRLRSELHQRGLRFRLDRSPIEGMRSRADIVFVSAQVAVFVDGCFWHSCPLHGSRPKNNAEWWIEKLQRNVTRDRRVDAGLVAAGWLPIRVWEHEDPVTAANAIESAVRDRV